MKKTLLVFCALLAWLISSSAQAATYAYRNDTFSYDTPSASAISVNWHAGNTGSTNGSPACTSYPLGDDDWADIVFANATTPTNNFTFTFAGTAYSGLRIYSNGMLVFGNDTSGQWRTYSNYTLPYATTLGAYATGCPGGQLGNAIIAYWTDIVAGTGNNTTGASVQYELLGAAPNRRLVVSWVNVKLYNQTARYNFQVTLFESPAGGLNSNFKYQYTTGSSTGSAATVGVQISTADYTLYSYNQAFIDPVAGSAILWYPANQLSGKAAEYHFDEASWNGTAGEVKDTSGSGQDAMRSGAATNVPGGKICRGGSFTANTSNTTNDAVATPIVPASVGSFDFWFNSNAKWNSADAMLFDATTATASRPFFLMKSSAGALKFSVTDSAGTVLTVSSANQTFALNTWHHVGVSWNLKPGTNQTLLQIFLDGVLTTSLRTTSSGSIYPLSTVYIGDNRTSGVTPTGGTPNGANGIIDETNIYMIEINPAQVSYDMNASHTCNAVDHYHVIHNGSAVTCITTPVTIQAHDVNHALVALSGVTLSLSTSLNHGNWTNIAGGSINPITNNGNGSASYVFSNESSVTFGLSDPTTTAESLVIGATSSAITTTSGSAATCTPSDYTFGSTCNAALSFAPAGFIVSGSTGGAGATIPAQVAGMNSSTYYLRAVKTNTTTQACEAALIGANTVNFGYECNNPTTCSGSNLMSVNGGTATTIARNNNGSKGASNTSVGMTFDANGNAPFTLNYGDAGQVTLYASKAASGNLLTALAGSTNAFVVKPAGFKLSNIKQTASPYLANPAAANAAGNIFVKAGEYFTATATAIAINNATTPNFGNETTQESAKLIPTLASGLGLTNNPAIGSTFGTFTSGVGTGTSFAWNEVGIINLTPAIADANYLGAGDVGTTGSISSGSNSLAVNSIAMLVGSKLLIQGASTGGDNLIATVTAIAGTTVTLNVAASTTVNNAPVFLTDGINVGRFYPDHFDTEVNQVSGVPMSCPANLPTGLTCPSIYNGFAYSAQQFGLTVTARNASGGTTANYNTTSGFSKTVTLSPFGLLGTTNPVANVGSLGVASVSAFAAGTLTVNNEKFTFTTPPAAPTNIYIRADDTEASSLRTTNPTTTSVEGGVAVLSGRIKISNAYGSELLPLTLQATAQYYSANGWVNSLTDSVTKLALAYGGTLTPIPAVTLTPTTKVLSGGNLLISLTAPGAGKTGTVLVTPSIDPASPGNPVLLPIAGTATFGIFKDNNGFIYRRESY